MLGLLLKIAILVSITHGLRVLGHLVGPRRCGLLMGLPSTTAIVLIACGHERGLDDAVGMAEASLLGLVAAVTLPLAYAHALGFGWPLRRAVSAAVLGYVVVAWSLGRVAGIGAVEGLGFALIAVLTACGLAVRIPEAQRVPGRIAPSRLRSLVLRTVIPVTCLIVVTALREAVGAHWAGLMSTFPGMTLTVLVVTALEAGPAEAGRMAKALPLGNLGMVAFLGAFRFGCPVLGLGWGTTCAYACALGALLAIAQLRSWPRCARVARIRIAREIETLRKYTASVATEWSWAIGLLLILALSRVRRMGPHTPALTAMAFQPAISHRSSR